MTDSMIRRLALGLIAGVGLMAVAVPAATAATTVNEQVAMPQSGANPCNGDAMDFTGNAHILIRFGPDGNGGYAGTYHLNLDNMQGTDLVTGAKYQFVTTANIQTPFDTNGATTTQAEEQYKLVGDGSAPNFYVFQLVHLTFNANGQPTAAVTNESTNCPG